MLLTQHLFAGAAWLRYEAADVATSVMTQPLDPGRLDVESVPVSFL